MQTKNLGMAKNQIMFLEVNGTVQKYYNTLKEELSKHTGIINISGSNDLPVSIGSNTGGFRWQGKDPTKEYMINYCGVDYNFFETYGVNPFISTAVELKKGEQNIEVVSDANNEAVRVSLEELAFLKKFPVKRGNDHPYSFRLD